MKIFYILLFICFVGNSQTRGFQQSVYNSHSNPSYPSNRILVSELSSFNLADATASFNEAMLSNNDFIVFDKINGVPTTYIIEPTRLNGVKNKTIVFEEGVTLTHKAGYMRSTPGKSIIGLLHPDNVKIYGYGAIIEIDRTELSGENQHCISIEGGTNVEIKGFMVKGIGFGSGGDGVYVRNSTVRPASTNIIIEDIISKNQSRQGISVISADGLLIKNCWLQGSNGRFPRSGIDLEGASGADLLQNITIQNVTCDGNYAQGIVVALYFMNSEQGSNAGSELISKTSEISILIKDSVVKDNVVDLEDNETGPFFDYPDAEIYISGTKWKECTGYVNLENVEIITNKSHAFSFDKIADNSYAINIKNCIVTMTENHKEPVLIKDTSWADKGLGGVHFNNTSVSVTNAVDFLFSDVFSHTYPKNITGTINASSLLRNSIRYKTLISNPPNPMNTQNFNLIFGEYSEGNSGGNLNNTTNNVLQRRKGSIMTQY